MPFKCSRQANDTKHTDDLDDLDDCYNLYSDLENIFAEEETIPDELNEFSINININGNNLPTNWYNNPAVNTIIGPNFEFHIENSIQARHIFLTTDIDNAADFLINDNNDTNWNTNLKTLVKELIKAFSDGDVDVADHAVNIVGDVMNRSSDDDVINGEHCDKSNYATNELSSTKTKTDEQINDDEFLIDFIDVNIFNNEIYIDVDVVKNNINDNNPTNGDKRK